QTVEPECQCPNPLAAQGLDAFDDTTRLSRSSFASEHYIATPRIFRDATQRHPRGFAREECFPNEIFPYSCEILLGHLMHGNTRGLWVPEAAEPITLSFEIVDEGII